MDLIWAEVGERLNLTKTEMRAIRTTFGDTLGLQTLGKVPEHLVPVIGAIAQLRRAGVPDQEINRRLKEANSGGGWPEEVLARMQTAACVVPRSNEGVVEARRHLGREIAPSPATLDASLPDPGVQHEPTAPQSGSMLEVEPVPESGKRPVLPPASHGPEVLPEADLSHDDCAVPTLAVRNMITSLRTEICSQAVEQREILHRMNQLLQDLVLEVRDLRWAIILSSSRKERKRGNRTITKLLSG